MQRLTENTPNGPVIHADDPNQGDGTLCCLAFEGEDGESYLTPVDRGRINCPVCLAIIRHCKAISSRLLA